MRILFIDPPGIGQPRVNKRGMNLNLSLAALSSVLLQHQHKVSLLDMENHNENRSPDAIEKCIELFKPDIIGVSIINAQYVNAMDLLKNLRKKTDATIIVGGAEVTAVEEKIFLDSDFAIDISVLGEGEESLSRIAECLENHEKAELANIPGLIINKNRILQKTGSPQILKEIDHYPFPNFDLFGLRRIKLYKIIGSRGCPHHCSFCFKYLGTTWRFRTPRNIVQELLIAKDKYHYDSFRFDDSNFNFKLEWTHHLCDMIMQSKLSGIPWGAALRADNIDRDLCQHMIKAGCEKVFIGVESLHPEVFKLINKGETIDQVTRGVRIAQEYFKEVQIFLIIGLPCDTKERTLYSYHQAKKLGRVQISYSMAVPYSKTRLENWVKSHAIIHGGSYDSFTRGTDAYKSGVAFETKEFSKLERLEIFKKLNIKSYRYISKSKYRFLTPMVWLKDAFEYDTVNFFKHILHISNVIRQRFWMEMKLLRHDASEWYIDYKKVPDGTWWLE